MFLALRRVQVAASDFPRSRRFYGETLGLPEVGAFENDWVEFGLGPIILKLIPLRPGEVPSRNQVAAILSTATLEPTLTSLKERGVTVVRGPIEEFTGRSAEILDPDGYRIVVFQPSELHPDEEWVPAAQVDEKVKERLAARAAKEKAKSEKPTKTPARNVDKKSPSKPSPKPAEKKAPAARKGKPSGKKAGATKPGAKKASSKKASAKASKKPPARKPAPKKPAPKKPVSKKPAAKPAARKTVAKKGAPKKAAPRTAGERGSNEVADAKVGDRKPGEKKTGEKKPGSAGSTGSRGPAARPALEAPSPEGRRDVPDARASEASPAVDAGQGPEPVRA